MMNPDDEWVSTPHAASRDNAPSANAFSISTEDDEVDFEDAPLESARKQGLGNPRVSAAAAKHQSEARYPQ